MTNISAVQYSIAQYSTCTAANVLIECSAEIGKVVIVKYVFTFD